jgi:hypothetical protein
MPKWSKTAPMIRKTRSSAKTDDLRGTGRVDASGFSVDGKTPVLGAGL